MCLNQCREPLFSIISYCKMYAIEANQNFTNCHFNFNITLKNIVQITR